MDSPRRRVDQDDFADHVCLRNRSRVTTVARPPCVVTHDEVTMWRDPDDLRKKDRPARCFRRHSNVVHSRRRCHSDASQCRPVGRLRVSDERRLRGSTTVNSSTKGGSRRDTSRAVAHCRAEETGRDRGAHPTEKAQVLVSSSDSFAEAKHSLCFKREPPQPFVEPVVATPRSAASSAACASPAGSRARPTCSSRSICTALPAEL